MIAPERRKQLLDGLCNQLKSWRPGLEVGWDLPITFARPDEPCILIDVFNLSAEDGLTFHRQTFRMVREAEKAIGESIVVVTHTPADTAELYHDFLQSSTTQEPRRKTPLQERHPEQPTAQAIFARYWSKGIDQDCLSVGRHQS